MRERTLVLQAIMRIMYNILAKIQLEYVPRESILSLVNIALKQVNQSIGFVEIDYLLCEFSLTYLSCLARVLLKMQLKNSQDTCSQPQLEALAKSACSLLSMLQEESEIDTFLIAIEDVMLYIVLNNQELLLQQLL